MRLPPFADAGAAKASAGDYEGVSAQIRRYCGWHVFPRISETVVIDDPAGAADLFLPTLKLIAITGCTVSGTALTADELAALDWTSYGAVSRPSGGRWPLRRRSVTFTIDHGHDQAPDLAKLCVELTGRAVAGRGGVRSKSMADRSVQLGGPDLTAAETDLLDLYRLPGLPV